MQNEKKLVGLKRRSSEINKIVTESLKEALILLIKDKPYEKITIVELCQKAGVSRMGFYGNFQTKDDIVKRIVIDLNKILVDRIGSPFRQTTDDKWYYSLFCIAKEYSDVLISLKNAGFLEEYNRLINDIVLHDTTISTAMVYQRIIWNGGIVNAIYYWLSTGMRESAEEMGRYCSENLVPWSIAENKQL